MKSRKLLFTIFMIFTLACFVAAGVCLIVDVAINRQITWAEYPLLSIAFGWLALSPLLLKKHRIVLCLCAFTLLILPYLFLLSKITPVKNWFVPIGLPAAIVGVIASGLLFLLFRFAKINVWYKLALAVLLCAVISAVIGYFVDVYLGTEPFRWDTYLNIFSCLVASAVLGILGYVKSKPKSD